MIPLTFTAGFGNGDVHLTVPPVTVVYGGGGPFGIAYGLGVAHALLDAGIPLRETPSLGTSAGAWVASCLATHTSFDAVDMMPAISVPNLSPGLLHRLAKDLFGEAGSALVTATAVRVPSGRRVLLSGAKHPLADIIAASSAVPWLFAPARIGRQVYADGGVRSMVPRRPRAHRRTADRHRPDRGADVRPRRTCDGVDAEA